MTKTVLISTIHNLVASSSPEVLVPSSPPLFLVSHHHMLDQRCYKGESCIVHVVHLFCTVLHTAEGLVALCTVLFFIFFTPYRCAHLFASHRIFEMHLRCKERCTRCYMCVQPAVVRIEDAKGTKEAVWPQVQVHCKEDALQLGAL